MAEKIRLTKTGITAPMFCEPAAVDYWVNERGWVIDPTDQVPGPPGSQPVTHDELDAFGLTDLADVTTTGAAAGGVVAVTGVSGGVPTAWRVRNDLMSKSLGASYRVPGISAVAPAVMSSPPTIAVTGPGGSTPIASARHIPYDTADVTRLGCLPTVISQFGTDYHTNGVNGAWTAPPWSVEFDYYGADLAVQFRAKTGGTMWLWVDGRPATAAPVAHGGVGGSLYYYRVTFGGAALRRIRLYFVLNADFGGLDIGGSDAVTPTGQSAQPSIAWLGQSYVEGTAGMTPLDTFATIAGQYLGFSSYYTAQGGTGLTTNAGDSLKDDYTAARRLNPLHAVAPDYVMVVGTGNDDGATSGQISTAFTAVLDDLAANLPNSQVIVMSPPATGTTPPAGRAANSSALQSVCAARGLPYIDMLTAPWVTGTGKSGTPASDGSADVFLASDGVHPTLAGHAYLGRRIGRAVQEILAAR